MKLHETTIYSAWDEWDKYKQDFSERLTEFSKVESNVDWHKSEPFLIETISYAGKEIQILSTPCKTAEELVATFDWGCCCFAFDGTNYIYAKADLDSIKAGEYLRLNKITFPYSTLRRGYRFSERFLMRLHSDDLHELCRQIIKKADTPKEKRRSERPQTQTPTRAQRLTSSLQAT